jgi:hypothetical protein
MAIRTAVFATGFGLFAMLGATQMALAKVTQYECKFEQSRARGGGWIPEILVITDDDKSGEIIAYDPIIKHFVGKPIPARRSAETKARVTYVWDLETRVKEQASKMTYTISYFRNGQPAKMRAQPGGYDNVWSGEGTCKVITK